MTNKNLQSNQAGANISAASSEVLIEKYKKPLWGALIAVVVLVGGYFLYQNYVVAPREAKAEELMFKGQEYFANDVYDKALNGDGASFPGFIQLANQYSSTKTGNLANLYAGLSLAKTGKYQEAISYLEKFDDCDDEMISPAAIAELGNCYAEVGNLDEAADYLVKAAERADNNSLSPIFLIQAGEIFEAQGNKDQALECYETIKQKYVNSMQYSEIEKYIERVSK